MTKPVYICIPTTEERRERLAKCLDSIHKNAGYPHVIVTYENFQEGFIGPIHRILEGIKDDTVVWCIGDDTVLTEESTLLRLVDAYHNAFPSNDGVANPDDGIQKGQIITMPLCSAFTMKKYTFKGYFLNYADNEFTEIMTAKGKYLYVPEVQVEHQHWIAGKAKKDNTYEHAASKFPQDAELFKFRKANGFEPKNEF